jgi:hypothetical protein
MVESEQTVCGLAPRPLYLLYTRLLQRDIVVQRATARHV